MKQQSANDWASSDPTKNITLAEADLLRSQAAQAVEVQFSPFEVHASGGETISEHELRGNTFMSPLPVNLFTSIAGGFTSVNVATFKAALKRAATDNDPITAFLAATGFSAAVFTRWPAVQQAIVQAITDASKG